MSKFEHFVKNLSDHELAIFFRYSYYGFLKKSQRVIDNEIKQRNLSARKLELLSHEKLNADLAEEIERCSRCGSLNQVTETDFWEIPFNEFSTIEMSHDSHRCQLCGINQEKSQTQNFLEKIKSQWIKTTTSNFFRWNSN